MAEPAYSSHALTTIEAVKRFAVGKDVIPPEHDPLLIDYINMVSEMVEDECSRHFEKVTYTDELHVGTGRQDLLLNQFPILTPVDYVKNNDVVVPSTEYIIKAEAGILFRVNGWFGGEVRLGGLVDEPHPWAVNPTIKVKYSAGYILPKDGTALIPQTLPYKLQGLVNELVLVRYRNRDALGKTEEAFEGYSTRYTWWPKEIVSQLEYYKTVATGAER